MKILAALAVIAALMTGAYFTGVVTTTQVYLPQIESLETVIEQADANAATTKKRQEKTNEDLQNEHAADRGYVANYYDGLREQEARAKDIAERSRVTDRTLVTCTTAGESGTVERRPEGRLTSCSVDVEDRCVQDALTVSACRAFFLRHSFPIAQRVLPTPTTQ